MCVLDISKVTYSQASIKKTEWAEILDSGRDVDLEFKKLNLATSFNFELDGFQKQVNSSSFHSLFVFQLIVLLPRCIGI